MRFIFLAFAMIFSLANTTSDRIDALLDEGKETQAFEIAKSAAETGDTEGHGWLGWFYDHGVGVETDLDMAIHHYQIAINGGENYARWRVGVLIDTGEVKGSLEEAVALFEACAAEDFENGLVSLAVMQATGRGTPQDYAAALNNYMRAARMGNAGGVRGVAVMVLNGEGVDADPLEGAAWMLLSASLGDSESESNLQYLLDRSPEDLDMTVIGRRALEIAEELGVDAPIVIQEDDETEPKVESG